MDRPRNNAFFTKRTEHYNNIQKEEKNNKPLPKEITLSPPKVNTPANVNKLLKTRIIQGNNTPGALVSKVENLDPNKKGSTPTKHSERPLKCLETLAQKAGITFDEKYDNQANLEKSQSPAQVANVQQHLPLQLTQEHFNQLQQQFQLQQAFGQGATIHVKQEYPNQAGNAQNMTAEMKSQLVDANQQLQLQQMQILDQSAPQSPHQSNQNAQNAAMATLQQQVQAGQVPAEWQHGRVQVLQQPIQNSYMQQMYSPLLMSNGNILHGGIGQQQIQLISAPKPFQGNQLTPQMLTTQGKPVIGGPQSNFGGYTLPNSIASSQAQTLLFSPVGLVNQQGQQQQNILQQQGTPTKTTQDGQKQMTVQKVMQKVGNSNQTNTAVSAANQQQQTNQQCVQVSQAMPTAQLLSPLHQNNGQAMQFAPWQIQGMGPFFTTNQFQPQTLLASNQIFIRGTNPDGTPGMFLQQSPQQTQTVQQSPQHQPTMLACSISQNNGQKPRPVGTEAQKSQQQRPQILPQGPQIRPASSVSTQTGINQLLTPKIPKVRTKQTPVRPAGPNIKVTQQPTMQQVVTTAGNKMVVMSNTPINISGALGPVIQQNQLMTNEQNKQQIQMQQMKAQQAQQVHQQSILQQAQQQIAIQQQLAHIQQQQQQQQHIQHQQYLNQQAQANSQNMQANQMAIANQNAANQMVQQVVLQQHSQMPTVTVTSTGMNVQPIGHMQHSQNIKPQHQMIINASQSNQMDRGNQMSVVSIASSLNNTALVTSASNVTQLSDTSNTILGPLASPQGPLHPPQNPLIAMTTLSTSPMTSLMQKDIKSQVNSNQQTENTQEQNINDSMKAMAQSNGGLNTLAAMGKKLQEVEAKNAEEKKTEAELAANSSSSTNTQSTLTTSTSLSMPLIGQNTSSSTSKNVNQSPQTVSTPKTNSSPSAASLNTSAGDDDSNKAKKTLGSMNNSSSHKIDQRDLPKAMVKPNVLTHVIEGFVIQEASEPFPVTRQRYSEKENDEPPKKKMAVEGIDGKAVPATPESLTNGTSKLNGGGTVDQLNVSSSSLTPSTPSANDMVPCENCGKPEQRGKLKKKRFCTLACARLSKTSSTDNLNEDDKMKASPSLNDKIKLAQSTPTKMDGDNTSESGVLPSIEEHVMLKWSVTEVCDFIKNLPGCSDYAEDFMMQEIDGQALLLLKENHLVSAMGMKLGPALKIVSKIESMRVSNNAEQSNQSTPTPPSPAP